MRPGTWLLLLAAGAAAGDVTVIRLSLSMEEEHSLTVDINTEYILEFTPPPGAGPSRLWVRSDGGDTAHPLLVTARLRSGASTWQVPYYVDERLLFELERTLCPDDSGHEDTSLCAEGSAPRSSLVVHVSSACAAPRTARLRAASPPTWALAPLLPAHLTVTLAAPRVVRYEFPVGQDSARLVVEALDDVCATVAVHNYTCPIAQTRAELAGAALRMTVLRSGGAQLARSRFPLGFYVVVVVHSSDEACTGQPADDADWLWEAAVARQPGDQPGDQSGDRVGAGRALSSRTKQISLTIVPALSRAQYAAGVGATLGVVLAFYVGFGALVVAQRWDRCARLVAPRAVLAHTPQSTRPAREESGPGEPPRRRDSTATFDSSDNSDTESEEGEGPAPEPITSVTIVAEAGAANGSFVPERGLPRSGPPDQHTDNGQTNGQTDNDTQPQAAAGARPFGLPARLHVAALARRRGRVLRARSDRYLYTLYTVAVFYALPVVQFVVAFQIVSAERVGLAGPVLLQLPVCAPPRRALGLQPRAVQPGLPDAGRAVHAAAAPAQGAPQAPAQGRGVRHPGALRAAVLAGRRHDGGGAAVGQLPRVPQPAQLPVRHGVHVRAGGAEHGQDLPVAPPRHQRARARYLRRARRSHRTRGVGRAGRRAGVLGRVHGAAPLHLPAAVAAHLLRGPVPPREAELAGGGARAARRAVAGLAAAVRRAAGAAADRQRGQLGVRAVRVAEPEHGLREPPAEPAAGQHSAVHGVLPGHEAAARRAAALVRVGVPGLRGRQLGAGAVLLHDGQLQLGRHAGAVAPPQPRVPRAAVLRRARPVAPAVGGRSLLFVQRDAHLGRRPLRCQAHRHCCLLALYPHHSYKLYY